MKIKRIIMPLFVFALLLTGCGGEKKSMDEAGSTDIGLVIIAGRHANACMFTDSMLAKAKDLIEESITLSKGSNKYCAKANVAVIVSDGRPATEEITLGGEDILSAKGNNKTTLKKRSSKIADNIIEFLKSESLKATDDEVDLLQAIYNAKNVLDGMPSDLEKHILIMDTGFTTHGYFNLLTNNIRDGEVSDVIARIDDGGIPDLTGVNVTFLGFGNVAGEQELGNKYLSRLVDVWTDIIEKEAGGTLTEPIRISEISNSSVAMVYYEDDSEGKGYPVVSPVMLPTEITYDVETRTIGDTDVDVLVVETIEQIEFTSAFFEPNTAVFRDKSAVVAALNTKAEEIKGYLSGDNEHILYVVGSIARIDPSKEPSKSNDVSKNRANAIVRILTEDYEIDANRIIAIDAGATEFSWRNANEFPGGKRTDKTPALQQKNRKVVIFGDCDVDKVQELKNAGYIQ